MSEFSQESIQIFQHLNTDSFKVKLELDNAWILQGEVTHWSLLEVKGLKEQGDAVEFLNDLALISSSSLVCFPLNTAYRDRVTHLKFVPLNSSYTSRGISPSHSTSKDELLFCEFIGPSLFNLLHYFP